MWMAAAVTLFAGWLLLTPPIPQAQEYYRLADTRRLLGVPNFWNVVSNLPFAVAGAVGLARFRDAASRVLFTGCFLTAFGSAYFHLAPGDRTLVWDRLPMTLIFMAAAAMVLGQWIAPARAARWLWPLAAFGALSVAWWSRTGDLRPYAVVQFAPAMLVAMAIWLVPGTRPLWPALALYALAKAAELFDAGLYSLLSISGHTAKHLLGALATYWIYRWRSTCFDTAPPSDIPPPAATPTGA
jgi:hypothetical protein